MENTLTSANKNLLKNIQFGRGIAALMVVFVHFPILPFERVWASGVDFFFTLSGFIIFYVHNKDFASFHKISNYLYRRIIRIYPIYWLIISTYLGIHYFLGNSLKDFYQADYWGILQTVFLFPNHPLVVLTSWTLSYELIFYMIVSSRFFLKKSYLFYILFLPSILDIFGYKFFFISGYFQSPFLAEAFLGILIFQFYQRRNIRLEVLFFCFATGFILLFLLPYLWINHRFFMRGIPMSLLLFSLVGLEYYGKNKIQVFWLHLGNASYILYLSHTIILSTLTDLSKKVLSKSTPKILINTSFVLIVIFLSILAHYIIEKRLLRFLKKGCMKTHLPQV